MGRSRAGFLGCRLDIFLRTLFAWQRRRGRELGLVGGQTGCSLRMMSTRRRLGWRSVVAGSKPEGARLRFVALPPPTVTVAQRLTDRLAADAEERSEYLDPDLAALRVPGRVLVARGAECRGS